MVMPQFAARTADYLRLLRGAGAAGALTAVHAEDAAIIALRTQELLAAGKTGVRFFPESRPVEAEEIAVHAALGYAEIAEAPIYLVHLSSRRAVEALRGGRERGVRAYGETRPLYLYLTREVFERPDGAIFLGQPPLRTAADRDAIWEALADGTLATVGTDHFPHRRADKLDPSLTFATIRPGVANLRTLLPMLYSEGVRRGRITAARLVDVLCTTPARLAGLAPRKGTLAVGSDADVVVLDPSLTRTVRSEDLRSNADHDPFAGWEVTGWPVIALSRGVVVARDGEIVGSAGHGRFTPRAAFREPASF
jgi:dihydropyrimidinase